MAAACRANEVEAFACLPDGAIRWLWRVTHPQRVFDVAVQGRVVDKRLDVARLAALK